MVISSDTNNHPENVYSNDTENNNIDKYVPVKKENTTDIECCQKAHQIEEFSKGKSDFVKAFDNVNSMSEDVMDSDENHDNEENIQIKVIASTSTPTVKNPIHIDVKNVEDQDTFEAQNECVDNSNYGNIVIMEFSGKTKELVSGLRPAQSGLIEKPSCHSDCNTVCTNIHSEPEPEDDDYDNDYEDLLDDVFSNSKFNGVCSTGVPLRCIESLPSIFKTKKYGGPKMVAFHVIKPELIPELLKVDKLHVSKVWEFVDKGKDNVVKFTPEDEFPVICSLPDPVARNYSDLPIEIWGDNLNKDEKEIVKFNNTQLLKETRLLMISDCTSDNHKQHQYFLGICNECCTFPSGDIKLSHCGGCQLVAYCSKDCQKKNWKNHRDICKKMPIKKGRNVFARGRSGIHGEESWRNFIFELDEKARNAWKTGAQEECYPEELIYWGRYCNTCWESQMENLFDCACGCISYCSKEHKNMDMEHLGFCHALYICTQVYKFHKLYPGKVYLPYCKQVYDVFKPLTSMLDFPMVCQTQIEKEEWLQVKLSLLSERLSYPLTVIYVLQKVGVGPESKSVGEITSLNLHLLSHFAMLDPSVWEMVLHYLPSLKQLSVSYIGEQFITSRVVNSLNITCTNLKRCHDCEEKDRRISFEVFPMHYHMYFSSEHYSDPDAIGVFQMAGIIGTEGEDDSVHATTSFRNLTYNKHVPLILTDMQKNFLIDATKKINIARPVDVVMPIEHNPFAGFRSKRRHKCGYGDPIVNDAEYVACLIQK